MKARWLAFWMNDIVVRSVKTFAQAAGGALVTLLGSGKPLDEAFGTAAIISALATAICAVWNGVINPWLKKDLGQEQ
jgi:hypothetical protein